MSLLGKSSQSSMLATRHAIIIRIFKTCCIKPICVYRCNIESKNNKLHNPVVIVPAKLFIGKLFGSLTFFSSEILQVSLLPPGGHHG